MGSIGRASLSVVCASAVAAMLATPVAHADSFVRCSFSTAKPFIYTVDGVDRVGSRVNVSDCQTDLPSTPLTFQMHLTVSGAPPGTMDQAHTSSFFETRDVHNGDSFSVDFPNADRVVSAYPGVLGAKVVVLSPLPGYYEPRFLDYQCSTWQFRGYECPPAQTH